MRSLFYFFLFLLSLSAQASDEDKKNNFSLNADVVSTYVWRGSYQAGTSIQPCMELNVGGFSLGTWGSVDIAGFNYKEVDLMASYSFKNVTIGLIDYWVVGEMNYGYFDFSKSTLHLLDAWLSCTFNSIPLTISWNTIVVGDEHYSMYEKKGKMKKAFPTYIEAIYSAPVRDINLEAAIGISPWRSGVMYNRVDEGGQTDGLAVINLSLKASKEITITDRYALPVFGQLILNPAKEDLFLVFGIKF